MAKTVKTDAALDNRSGDQVVPEEAWKSKPQHVDGGTLDESAVTGAAPRPKKRVRLVRVASPALLDNRDAGALPGEDGYRATPQSVDGPEVDQEQVKPRG